MHQIDILVIDDDEDDYLIVKSLLQEIAQGPLRLEWASNYNMGEQLLAENRHQVCLMDYQLGARDGISLLKTAPALGFAGPIILLTGMHHTHVDMLALQAGAVDYLVKNGLTAEQLARSIRYALGRREIEIERIERLRAEAENRSKSEFLAHLSHELRTPLSAILGFTELLINSRQTEEHLSHLTIVHRNGKHLLGLLNDILDLSKIEAGKLDLEIQPLHLVPFIADVYWLMRSSATDKNLHLNVLATTELPEIIHTDPTRLRQVLLNLIGNAIKFTYEGSIDITIALMPREPRPYLLFRIQDSGIGIDAGNLDAILKPFVQIKNARIQTRTGTGLGLAISQQLVEHLGGNIKVESEEHVGSVFSFTIDPGDLTGIPRHGLSLQPDSPAPSLKAPPQFDGRILVVDDLRDIRALIGHYIKRCGLNVEYAANGLEAITKLQNAERLNQPFSLILMDIHMPVKDGVTAAREIRALGHTCPLVALTAAHMKGDQDIYLNAGFNASLSKPVDQSQVIHVLEQFLLNNHASSRHPKNAALANQASEKQTAQAEQKTILVVEDSEDALAATKSLLELLGWQAFSAPDVKTALAIAEAERPPVAMVDLHLPDGDGYQLSEALEALIPDIAIYISSGAELDPTKACQAIRGQLLKPISLEQLSSILEAE